MNIISSILLINNSGGGVVLPLTGWSKRKLLTVAASVSIESIIEFDVYNTSGTDTTTEIYLNGDVRADWGDLRFTSSDETTCLPFAILYRESDHVTAAVNLGVIQNGTFYIYWDGPALSEFRIGHLTDIHYDPAESSVDKRDQSLVMTASFVARMATYFPHLVAGGGDWVGNATTSDSPRLALIQDTLDELYLAAGGPSEPEVMWVAPGNHDFDHTTFADTRAILSQAWMETNTLYGQKEVGDYLIVSLDASYIPSGQSHQSETHDGFGYVNTDQLTWLTAALTAATKPVIIFCHQPLSEMDTEQFTLTKETYHTQNRAAVRDILEASNKVVCCIHGHVHYSRIDVIRGIPYITITNIGNVGQFGEQPATNTGKWGLITLDASSKTIKVQTEAIVSGDVELIYEQIVGFGPTSLTTDVGQAPERVYALSYAANFEKSSIMRDPVIGYVNDDTFLYKYPTNYNIPDPFLSENTIKVVGRTNSANFGRIIWRIASQTGTFRARWKARVSTVKTKFFKFGDSSVATTPGPYVQFNSDGNIKCYNGVTNTTVRAYSVDTWYEFELVANIATDTYSVWVDGVLEASGFAFNNALTSIDRVEIVTETGNIYIDNFRIQPYTDIALTL
jgi:Icc-related predicted phosphoesterase